MFMSKIIQYGQANPQCPHGAKGLQGYECPRSQQGLYVFFWSTRS